MNYDLDFDTSLLDYHSSKVDDLPYLDLFHDDKLDFGEDRQDCADLADAASPNDVIGGIFDCIRSSSEAEEESELKDDEKKVEKDANSTNSQCDVGPTKRRNTKKTKELKPKDQDASQEKAVEEPEVKRPRRSTRQYNLRQTSIINRIETETRRAKPKEPKPKSKPPPLSKYRRRTANSRERTRMAEINDAFEVLRNAIPNYSAEDTSKLTKITTLRLALNYIGALREMLGYSDPTGSQDSSSAITIDSGTGESRNANISSSKSCAPPLSVESKLPTSYNLTSTKSKSVNSSCASDVTLTKGSASIPTSADPALTTVNTDPFSDFNLAAINFSSTVPSPGSSTTISSSDNLSCINTNMNCLSPGTTGNCLSPDSMNCVSPSLSLTCSSPGSSVSDCAAINYYGLPYVGLCSSNIGNPLDSEGESVTSLS